MSNLAKFGALRVSDVMSHAGMEPASRAALQPDLTIGEAIAVLNEAGDAESALKLVAHALPKREAVWWAATCCRASRIEAGRLAEDPAVVGAEAWVYDPADGLARKAYAEAERQGFQTPEAWVAVAAFWSSSSLSPPEQQPVKPAEYLTGVAVVGAVSLAAVVEPLSEMNSRHHRFLNYALDIANGGTARDASGQPL